MNSQSRTVHDLIATEGEDFPPQPLPYGVRRGRPKQCYANAQRLVASRDDLTYVEGIADGVEHAWCIDERGHVVDPTWEHDPELEYRGLRIETRRVLALASYDSILWPHDVFSTDPRTQWPALLVEARRLRRADGRRRLATCADCSDCAPHCAPHAPQNHGRWRTQTDQRSVERAFRNPC